MVYYLSESRRVLDVALNDCQLAGLLKPAVMRNEPITAMANPACS